MVEVSRALVEAALSGEGSSHPQPVAVVQITTAGPCFARSQEDLARLQMQASDTAGPALTAQERRTVVDAMSAGISARIRLDEQQLGKGQRSPQLVKWCLLRNRLAAPTANVQALTIRNQDDEPPQDGFRTRRNF